ncbi:MAG: DNA mismatch repair endonuclease MutL [Clostridia bacterium]|nr:DNA mismatch repair endonuclease MutL [Clostridia bacterium]
MPKINLLPKNVAELIAAGEVVERPASVIKELVENSIDAKATQITVEIQRGGITYIRITDNGIGIEAEDVPTAFLRHATSKIKTQNDLDSIATLGFRGEALAAVSSVSKVEMLTCSENSNEGIHYSIEGGEEKFNQPVGCPRGTTIIIRDIFYNTPARMKFLKKDVSEGNACASVVERIALSHPEIAFKLIRDGKTVLTTSGNGDTKACVYAVLGRDFSNSLVDVNDDINGIKVSGLICKPFACKATRSGQYTFLNGRLVRSGTVIAAVEQAYKNSAMVGKFPAFVLYLEIPFDTVDVNVHPAKTEVRFSDEKRIFDAVYASVKNALTVGDTRPEIKLNKAPFNPFQRVIANEYRQQAITETVTKTPAPQFKQEPVKTEVVFKSKPEFEFMNNFAVADEKGEKIEPVVTPKTNIDIVVEEEKPQVMQPIVEEKDEIIIIGEAFSTYIVAQMGDSVFMIDKHAAHERILYNKLKAEEKTEVQALLTPVTVTLSSGEYDAVINNLSTLEKSGFEVEDFGNSTVIVRGLPVFLTNEDIGNLLSEIAESLITTGKVSVAKEDNVFHTVACRAAVKAGNNISRFEMLDLAKRVLLDKEIMYCPHGRPVAFEIKKRELEKQFGRIQ